MRIIVRGKEGERHDVGNLKCQAGWCRYFERFIPCPKVCKCGGVIHAEFFDEFDDTPSLHTVCDRCKCDEYGGPYNPYYAKDDTE